MDVEGRADGMLDGLWDGDFEGLSVGLGEATTQMWVFVKLVCV